MAAQAGRLLCGNSTGAASIRITFFRWMNIIGKIGQNTTPRCKACAKPEDMSAWLEYCAAGLRQTLERAWLRIKTLQVKSADKLVLRPRQEQLLHLLRDHGSMAPAEIWEALGVSRQGAMDLLRPLLDAGVVEN